MDTTKFLLNSLVKEQFKVTGEISNTTYSLDEQYELFNKLKLPMRDIEEQIQKMEEFTTIDLQNIEYVLEEIFVTELNWGKVLSALALTSKLCERCIQDGREEFAYEVINRVYVWLERKGITVWIENQYPRTIYMEQQKIITYRKKWFIRFMKLTCLIMMRGYRLYYNF